LSVVVANVAEGELLPLLYLYYK